MEPEDFQMYKPLDPFRNFNFWKHASVAEVRSEVEKGTLTTSFPSSTWVPKHLTHLVSMYRSEEVTGETGQVMANGGLTLLHWAIAGQASKNVVSYLLSIGIPVSGSGLGDAVGATPLHYASQLGASETCDLLLAHGADIEAWSDWGTPLQWAVAGLDPQALVIISDRYGTPTQMQADGGILFSMPTGWMDDPIFLSNLFQMEKGAVADHHYRLNAMWPKPQADISTVELMLRKGADVSVKAPRFGWTTLHLAAMFNPNPEIARLLIEHGAETDAVTDSDNVYKGFDLDIPNADVGLSPLT